MKKVIAKNGIKVSGDKRKVNIFVFDANRYADKSGNVKPFNSPTH